MFVHKPHPGNSACLGLRQSAAYFSQASLQLGSAGCSKHLQGNRHKQLLCVCRVIHASVQISEGLGCPISGLCLDHLVLPFLACADRWRMGIFSFFGCPVLTSIAPAVAGHKGLTTGGPCVQPAAGGMWGVTPVQLYKLQQLSFPS